MDTRLPYFDGQKDFLAFLRFLDNRKEYKAYDKKLSGRIMAFNKAVEVYGKAQDIEKLHHDAELIAVRAESAFAEREVKLKAGEETLAAGTTTTAAAWEKHGRGVEASDLKRAQELDSTAKTLKAREAEVGKRENAIAARERRAEKAQEAAQGAKQEADAMVVRMKAATAA